MSGLAPPWALKLMLIAAYLEKICWIPHLIRNEASKTCSIYLSATGRSQAEPRLDSDMQAPTLLWLRMLRRHRIVSVYIPHFLLYRSIIVRIQRQRIVFALRGVALSTDTLGRLDALARPRISRRGIPVFRSIIGPCFAYTLLGFGLGFLKPRSMPLSRIGTRWLIFWTRFTWTTVFDCHSKSPISDTERLCLKLGMKS